MVDLSALVCLLDGHRYAMELAAHWIKAGHPFQELVRKLSDTAPDRRVSRMVAITIEGLDDPSFKLLESLALFMSPVSDATVETCFETSGAGKYGQAGCQQIIGSLTDLKLVFKGNAL